MVWPVATYGCEAWTLKAADKNKIAGFEMMAFRNTMGINGENTTNQSILDQLDTTPCLLQEIQRRKLQYFGHVVGADNLYTTVFHGQIDEVRKQGKPRK